LALEINYEAHDFGANLIVMGSRGLTDFEGLLRGQHLTSFHARG